MACAAVVSILSREAAAETGAVENLYSLSTGDTRTIATQAEGWEELLPESMGHFLDQVNAYELIREASKQKLPVTAGLIRDIHKTVCATQTHYTGHVLGPGGILAPVKLLLKHGEYKEHPNHVIDRHGRQFSYAPVLDTPIEIQRFVDELDTLEFQRAHPVVKAAYAHYSFVRIHPFADGNGRVARALASYFTYQLCDLPLVVYADRKQTYRQALEAADLGRYQGITTYMTDLLIDAAGRARQELRIATHTTPSTYVSAMLDLVTGTGDLTVEDTEKVGNRFWEAFVAELKSSVATALIRTDGTITYTISRSDEYSQPGLWITAIVTRGAEVSVTQSCQLEISRDMAVRSMFKIRWDHPETDMVHESLALRFDDLHPTISDGAQARIKLAAEDVVGALCQKLFTELKSALGRAGYDNHFIDPAKNATNAI
ncbi:hypothetical protein GCM10009661_84010 [Catellatospora chokoriensis]|uniref:Fido domain-containing protein n=2 Tax=Catellatospora chokoriensis TaxID=310353 RepID=A0A8J3NW93_9ACTN|nr:hypothetical protein Cch02nite_82110 [Catellatospora chokoriensis]